MTVDNAEGVEGGDYNVANVWNIVSGEQCCNYRFGDGDTLDFAKMCVKICRVYNNALIGNERNNHGHAFITNVKNICKYSRLYKHAEDDRDGFPTNVSTRIEAISHAKRYFNDGYFKIHSLDTLKELATFVKYRGKMQASSGNNDDEVATIWIAAYVLEYGLLSNMQFASNNAEISGMVTSNYFDKMSRANTKPKGRRRVTGY